MKIDKAITNLNLTCPICGSHEFFYGRGYFNDYSIVSCNHCKRYKGWVSTGYRRKLANMTQQEFNKGFNPTSDCKKELETHKILSKAGFKLENKNTSFPTSTIGFKYYLNNNQYQYIIDMFKRIVSVKNLETNETKDYPLDSLIKKIKNKFGYK